MNRRLRFLAGVLTLVAMTASFTEAVLASACTPMADMDMDMDMGMDVGMGHADGGMSAMPDAAQPAASATPSSEGPDCMLTPGHDSRPNEGDRDEHCPLSPAVGSGCSAVATLPASGVLIAGPSGETDRARAPGLERPDLLLTQALFRPPRA